MSIGTRLEGQSPHRPHLESELRRIGCGPDDRRNRRREHPRWSPDGKQSGLSPSATPDPKRSAKSFSSRPPVVKPGPSQCMPRQLPRSVRIPSKALSPIGSWCFALWRQRHAGRTLTPVRREQVVSTVEGSHNTHNTQNRRFWFDAWAAMGTV
jgi:hypothetical protein